MNSDLLGIAASLIFVFLIIGISTLLTLRGVFTGESSRKFIHIGVSHWWIVAMYFFTNRWTASVVPTLFILLNYLSYRKSLFTAMEREEKGKSDLGTVYYAVSLTLLTLTTWEINPFIGLAGIMTMGYGDGLAALAGEKRPLKTYRIFGHTRSLGGSLTMLVLSLAAALIIFRLDSGSFRLLPALILALTGTLLEAVSPSGTDNLTVPLGSSLLYFFLERGVL